MRRLGRWLLNGVTALSLALCVAGIVFYALGAGGAKRVGRAYSWHGGTVLDGRANSGFRSGLAGPSGFTHTEWCALVGQGAVEIWNWQATFPAGAIVFYSDDATLAAMGPTPPFQKPTLPGFVYESGRLGQGTHRLVTA